MKFEAQVIETIVIEAENQDAAVLALYDGEGTVTKRIVKSFELFRTRLEKLAAIRPGGFFGFAIRARLIEEIRKDVEEGKGSPEEVEFVKTLPQRPDGGGFPH